MHTRARTPCSRRCLTTPATAFPPTTRRGTWCGDLNLVLTYPDSSRYTLTKDMGNSMPGNGAPDCFAGTTFLSAACSDVATARFINATSVPPLTGAVSSALSVLRSPGVGAAAVGTYTLTVCDDEYEDATRLVSAQLRFFAGSALPPPP